MKLSFLNTLPIPNVIEIPSVVSELKCTFTVYTCLARNPEKEQTFPPLEAGLVA
jgi:hypothetical protein